VACYSISVAHISTFFTTLAHGQLSDDPTIGTCWDADRLDLVRVGTQSEPSYMSTEFGSEIARSRKIATNVTLGIGEQRKGSEHVSKQRYG
jgi:hypothetical protein